MKLITDRHGGGISCQCLRPNTIKPFSLQQSHKTQELHLFHNILCKSVVKINALNTLSLHIWEKDLEGKWLDCGQVVIRMARGSVSSSINITTVVVNFKWNSYCHFADNTWHLNNDWEDNISSLGQEQDVNWLRLSEKRFWISLFWVSEGGKSDLRLRPTQQTCFNLHHMCIKTKFP